VLVAMLRLLTELLTHNPVVDLGSPRSPPTDRDEIKLYYRYRYTYTLLSKGWGGSCNGVSRLCMLGKMYVHFLKYAGPWPSRISLSNYFDDHERYLVFSCLFPRKKN